MGAVIRNVVSVFKLRIGVAIALTAMAGMVVTPGTAPEPWRVLALALAVLLSSAAAGAYNQYAERVADAAMPRTRRRPFATGAWPASGWWPAAIAALLVFAVTGAALATNAWAALYVFLGAFTYGVVYTVWLKRRTWLNIVIGGLAGSFAVLAGAAAVDPTLPAVPLLLALMLFLWTPPHFWSLAFLCRDEYRQAGVPMLPAVVEPPTAARAVLAHIVPLVAISVVPYWLGLGAIYLAGAVAGGAWFLVTGIDFAQRPGTTTARRCFVASLGQLTLLLVAALADRLLA